MKINNFKSHIHFTLASSENNSMKKETYGKFVKNVYEKCAANVLPINLYLAFQHDC